MKIYYPIIACMVIALALNSCKKDPEPEPESTPEPTPTITFQSDVLPIFNTHCNGGYCHGGGADGKSFDTHANVILVPSTTLIGAINHTSGFEAMPKSAAKLSQGEIDTISTWIDEGRLNN